MPNVKQQEHLTKDGQPDHRYKENRDDEDQSQDQRSNNKGDDHTKKGGEPDHRYKENRDDASHDQRNSRKKSSDGGLFYSFPLSLIHLLGLEQIDISEIPTKLDGTADMRYLQSREAVKSGLIDKDEVIEGKTSLAHSSISLSRFQKE